MGKPNTCFFAGVLTCYASLTTCLWVALKYVSLGGMLDKSNFKDRQNMEEVIIQTLLPSHIRKIKRQT